MDVFTLSSGDGRQVSDINSLSEFSIEKHFTQGHGVLDALHATVDQKNVQSIGIFMQHRMLLGCSYSINQDIN